MSKHPKTPKDLLRIAIETKDKTALQDWIEVYLKFRIPDASISGNSTPMQFIADFVFGDINTAIAIANRSGGKTINLAIANAVLTYYHDDIEISTLAAILSQAQRGYEYFTDFMNLFPFNKYVERTTMKKTVLSNGAMLEILVATMSGVNSPHPQIAIFDEIDLMKWNIIQQGMSMAQASDKVSSTMIFTSTRKFTAGPMQRMIDESDQLDATVYKWNIWDVVEPLPDDPQLREEIFQEFKGQLPKRINEADGFYKWEDVLQKHRLLDEGTWQSEWLCNKPGTEGVVYGTAFQEEIHTFNGDNVDFSSRDGHYYIAEDFGGTETHPDVALLVWVPPSFDKLVIVDERYMRSMNTQQIYDEINSMAKDHGAQLPYKDQRISGNITGWAPDYHGYTEIMDRESKGAPMMDKHPDNERYRVVNGISMVKKLFEDEKILIADRCVELRGELGTYAYKTTADGRILDQPKKEKDHGPDALRFLVILLYDRLMKARDTRTTQEKVRDEIEADLNTSETITGNLLNRTF